MIEDDKLGEAIEEIHTIIVPEGKYIINGEEKELCHKVKIETSRQYHQIKPLLDEMVEVREKYSRAVYWEESDYLTGKILEKIQEIMKGGE